MKPETIARLHRINHEFYQTFAQSFASTRRRIQPGIRRVLHDIPSHGSWLDTGCGSGALAAEWARQKRTGLYYGIDFSLNLLEKAKKEVFEIEKPEPLEIKFAEADLMDENWMAPVQEIKWDGMLCFAVLHHIPGADQRLKICADFAGLLESDKNLYISIWQPMNSKKLIKRVQPWVLAGIEEDDLDAGDVLMDWRAENDSGQASKALRYVHCYNEDELSLLAETCGFMVTDCFYSDGKEGNLGLYQTWKKN